MKNRAALTIGLSALALGMTMVGCAARPGGVVSAGSKAEMRAIKVATKEAARARDALAKAKPDRAVMHAEAAVAANPRDAATRALLGQTYLAAGRFASAQAAFTDSLTLDPSAGRVALNLALAQTAQGNWDGARATLTRHADTIAVGDRGLALALAGDPQGAVELLTVAARGPDADGKVRQNLALSLALAGRWQEAKTMAAIDVAPGEVDARIMQWAAFSRPVAAADQVASLLGVTPMADPGQPSGLALREGPAEVAQVMTPGVASDAAVETYMPKLADAPAMVAAAPAPVEIAQIEAAPAVAQPALASVDFAPRAEIVQAVPVVARVVMAVPPRTRVAAVKPVAAPARPVRVAVAKAAVAPASGTWFVQLGAFENEGVAREKWRRAAGSNPALAGLQPSGMSFSAKGVSVYRLAVGGFARGDADRLCGSLKARGQSCFVRPKAGDAVVSWGGRKGVQVASRN